MANQIDVEEFKKRFQDRVVKDPVDAVRWAVDLVKEYNLKAAQVRDNNVMAREAADVRDELATALEELEVARTNKAESENSLIRENVIYELALEDIAETNNVQASALARKALARVEALHRGID